MADETLKLKLEFEADVKELERLSKLLNTVEKNGEQVGDAFSASKADAERFRKALSDVEKQARQTNNELDGLSRERKLKLKQERFDKISQQVGGAGDAGSALSTIGGTSGLTGVSRAGEAIELIEALPRLKESLSSLPEAVSIAAESLGTTSTGLIGALGIGAIAIGAMTIAFNRFLENLEKQQQRLRNAVDAQLETERLITSGGTTDEAKSRLADLTAEQRANQAVLQNLQSQYEQFNRASSDSLTQNIAQFGQRALTGGVTGAVIGEATDIGASATAMRSLNKEIKELEESGLQTEMQIGALSGALKEGRFTPSTASVSPVITQPAMTTPLPSLSGVQTQLRALESARDQSRESQRSIRTSARRNRASINRGSQRALEDASRTGQQALQTFFIEVARGAQSLSRKTNDALNAIKRQFEDAKSDLSASGDFGSLFQLQRDTARQVRDTKIDAGIEKREADIEAQQRLQDTLRSQSQERETILINRRRQLEDARISASQQLADSRRANRERENEVRRALENELRIVRNGLQQRLALEGQAVSASLGLMRQMVREVEGLTLRGAGASTNIIATIRGEIENYMLQVGS